MARRNHEVNSPDAELFADAQNGNPESFQTLADNWFDKIWNVSKLVVNDDAAATRIAETTLLNSWDELQHVTPPTAFGAWVLVAARRLALDELENRGVRTTRQIPTRIALDPDDNVRSVLIDSTSAQYLLWAVTQSLSETGASLVDLRLRCGLSTAELASALDVPDDEIQQEIDGLLNQLSHAIRNFFLWNRGQPNCDKLDQLVTDHDSYSAMTVRTIKNHYASCTTCKTDRLSIRSPEDLFAGIPLAEPPKQAKAAMKEALSVAMTSTTDELVRSAAATTAPTAVTVKADDQDSTVDTKPRPAESIRNPYPMSAVDKRFPIGDETVVNRRFGTAKPDTSSGFAQDAPVRYSSRPLRPVSKPRRFSYNKRPFVAAACLATIASSALVGFDVFEPESFSVNTATRTASPPADAPDATILFADQSAIDEIVPPTTTPLWTTRRGEPPTEQTQIVVPELTNASLVEVAQSLRELGLKVNVRRIETEDQDLIGRVRSTSPRAGEPAKPESVVVVSLYIAK